MSSSTKSSTKVVSQFGEWNPTANKFMPPVINKLGGKSIKVISTELNRSLAITTPLMMTWGCQDFMNDEGESDGKFKVSLNFPNKDYETADTKLFLQKMKAFENEILDQAVANSELWWGEPMSKEILKHTFFPFLKYSKDKNTKKIDLTKPPSISAKVPIYDGVWNIEIFDTKMKKLFPVSPELQSTLTPIDFIQKLSKIACTLQCGGIWIGGKGWGLTWKAVQCVVKPRDIHTIEGACQIKLPQSELDELDKQDLPDEDVCDSVPVAEPVKVSVPVDTNVEDSDSEEPEPEKAVAEPAVPVKKIVKKIVKKVAA